jgi:pseudaminic acid synthase
MRFRIGKRWVGDGANTLVIAELSANHLMKYDLAERTIIEAQKCGADAIKIQTYTKDTLTIDCDNEYFRIKDGIWKGKTLYKLYDEAYTPWEWQPRLKKLCDKLGIILFSTPFDKTAVDFLEKMGVPAYKIASFELIDTVLVRYAASKGKPIIMSTGIASLEDINDALAACREVGNVETALLKCTSAYPAPTDEMNLLTIPDMQKRFGCIIGLSDHSANISIPGASVALGAKIVETHFILDRKLGGPDSKFSLEPAEFKTMVGSIRDIEKALGTATYEQTESVGKSQVFARSLFVTENMKKGDEFTEKNVRSIRPGYGMKPKNLPQVLGKKAKKAIPKGTPLSEGLIS